MDLMTGLSAISQTLAITKELRNIDDRINVADFKLRLADLVERLLEAREALQDAKENERLLRSQIDILNQSLEDRGQSESDDEGRLFRLGDSGKRMDGIYCNHCFVKEEKFYRLQLIRNKSGNLHCSNCTFWCGQD